MRPAYALTLLLAIIASAAPATLADMPAQRFDVDVRITGGDVVLRVDLCGYGPGAIDLLGLDLGDPENAPITLHAVTETQACAGDGFVYRNVLAEGALNPPLHCYQLHAFFTSPTARMVESDDDCA